MIKSFKHKGLEKFFKTGNTRGIQSSHSKKLRFQLAALERLKLSTILIFPVIVYIPKRITKGYLVNYRKWELASYI